MTRNKRSDVERIKAQSRYLRGTIVESLADPVTGAIRDDDTQVLKFHGSYQQDDRDLRDDRRRRKLEPAYQFMIRTRLPGGVCTPAQWLALDDLATLYGNGSLRLTTRQAFQLHGVIKRDLKATLAAMNRSLVDTIAACGDVNRNVICAANPHRSRLHETVYRHAAVISEHLRPRTRAYHEIWLDEEKVAGQTDAEPIYGATYLPRKFKIAIALPPVNDVDVLAHDLGFIGVTEDGVLAGYNVSVGGGMGMSYDDPETHPRLADVIGFVAPEHLREVAEAVVTLQRDHGNRENRRRARLKYTIEDRGLDWFQDELQHRLGFELGAVRNYRFEHNGDRYGWVEGFDGRWHLTLQLAAGRVVDRPGAPQRHGLRRIAECHQGEFRLTPNQNLVIANVMPDQRDDIDALVEAHGLDGYRRNSGVRRLSLACVALPTCGQAMAEAERYLPTFMDKMEALLDRHGVLSQPILVRISGCANGCSRPYLAEVALGGKAPGRYNLYLGGDITGQRLNVLYRENVDESRILEALDPLIGRYARYRRPGEPFGDFLWRDGALVAAKAQA